MFSATLFLSTLTGFCFGVWMGWSVYPLINGERVVIESCDCLSKMITEIDIQTMDKGIQVEDNEVEIKEYFIVN